MMVCFVHGMRWFGMRTLTNICIEVMHMTLQQCLKGAFTWKKVKKKTKSLNSK